MTALPDPQVMTKAELLYLLQGGDPATLLARNLIETLFEYAVYPVAVLQDQVNSTVTEVAGTTYTLTQDDHNHILDFTSGSAVTVTVPEGLTLPFVVGISQGGAGQVTLDPDGTVVINEPDAQFKTEKQYSQIVLTAFAADSYRLSGPTAA